MKATVKTVVGVLCLVMVILGVQAYHQYRDAQKFEVQAYNQWMNWMQGVQSSLRSHGAGEKTNNGLYLAPNVALMQAQRYSDESSVLAGEAALQSHGQTASVFQEMEMVSQGFSNELALMIDHGKYVGTVYEYTQPEKITILYRDFMATQISNVLLNGMPASVKTVAQIDAQHDHLQGLVRDIDNKAIGVDNQAFDQLMKSTGKMDNSFK